MCDGLGVIGAGLGRTGTLSLAAALEILGYKTYHFVAPEHAEHWAQLAESAEGVELCIQKIAEGGYTATCDQPTADVFEDQMNLYPNAKVLLTVRDTSHDFCRSWKVLMDFIEVQERPFSLLYPSFIQWIPFMRHWKKMRNLMGTHIGLVPGDLIRGWRLKADPDAFLEECYEKHNAKVRSTVPSSNLLEFNVKEGWVPLCAFLNKPVPTQPFPFVNESGDLQTATIVMKVLSYSWIPLLMSSAMLISSRFKR
jgi:hypothetical protein